MRNRLLKEMPLPRDGAEREETRRGARKGRRRRPARTVKVNLAESPLGWLRSRGLVTGRQYEAGEALRADWERGQLSPGVTMRWDEVRGHPGPVDRENLTGAQVAARRRFHAAVEAVGSGLGDILWRVVCAGEGMRDAEQALGWPARSGRLVLALALDRLADHYCLR
ncbi:MAG TPA: DUF6456 domain-containing protein [Allosphingosinicella sp.]|nr:DUF6456 domain-containing protein [Allosphingosinicella sp.]